MSYIQGPKWINGAFGKWSIPGHSTILAFHKLPQKELLEVRPFLYFSCELVLNYFFNPLASFIS